MDINICDCSVHLHIHGEGGAAGAGLGVDWMRSGSALESRVGSLPTELLTLKLIGVYADPLVKNPFTSYLKGTWHIAYLARASHSLLYTGMIM